jgi:two-component system sensor histidine kinase DesK
MDNGGGKEIFQSGHGIHGMRERLSFVNGEMQIVSNNGGFEINIAVPKVLKEIEEG